MLKYYWQDTCNSFKVVDAAEAAHLRSIGEFVIKDPGPDLSPLPNRATPFSENDVFANQRDPDGRVRRKVNPYAP